MALTTTTLSAAITSTQTVFQVGSTTNITAPVFTTGTGYTWLLIENEVMFVISVPTSGTVQVIRGQLGTQALAHANTCGVNIGLPTDFPAFQPQVTAFATSRQRFEGTSGPIAAAASFTCPGTVFHVTGATQTTTMTPPTGFVEGRVTVIADTAWSWAAGSNQYNFGVAGTATTYPGFVDFVYDASKQLWYPSRVV